MVWLRRRLVGLQRQCLCTIFNCLGLWRRLPLLRWPALVQAGHFVKARATALRAHTPHTTDNALDKKTVEWNPERGIGGSGALKTSTHLLLQTRLRLRILVLRRRRQRLHGLLRRRQLHRLRLHELRLSLNHLKRIWKR
jgi:hypothetical protein